MKRIGAAIDRAIALPPGLPFDSLITIASALTLWQTSLPGGPDIFEFTIGLAGWLALGELWVIRFLLYLVRHRTKWIKKGDRLRWAVIPAVLTATAILFLWQFPLYLRFNAGQPELEEFARTWWFSDPKK